MLILSLPVSSTIESQVMVRQTTTNLSVCKQQGLFISQTSYSVAVGSGAFLALCILIQEPRMAKVPLHGATSTRWKGSQIVFKNLPPRNDRQIDIENKLVAAKGRGGPGNKIYKKEMIHHFIGKSKSIAIYLSFKR